MSLSCHLVLSPGLTGSQTVEDWGRLPEAAGRAYHGCALVNNTHLLVAGGQDTRKNHSQHLRSSWVLSLATGVWTQTGSLNLKDPGESLDARFCSVLGGSGTFLEF